MAEAAKRWAPTERTDVTVTKAHVPWWRQRINAVVDKVLSHWLVERVFKVKHHPIVTKSKELADDMRDRWETSDSPMVHRIQDLNDSLFGETATAMAMKEIKKRDPHFSLPDFVHEVHEEVRPLLLAYMQGDMDALRAKCRREVLERCAGERQAMQAQGLTPHQQILHQSELDVREIKLSGSDPIILLSFTTQEIYCLTDRSGKVTEGGKDTIVTVIHVWAMQQSSLEEMASNPNEPKWRVRQMLRVGAMQALV
eukprot:TRINITY_DN35115_c0_g1_i2.p1 TRINITY_DN35115_c0_g1~~TRINITY_DN35115_c0_g1_i2.p1  ORF type:complete len:254 (-),score=25.32 TRINITY_DN35115_c0_g1_i2:102-863(-)